jgi:acyl-coenzyme A synthetase/AMP-(fatty) acid ligase
MKRAVICVDNPQHIMDQLPDYSLMVLNPHAAPARNQYLIDNSDWSLLITNTGERVRQGRDYSEERLFWYTSGTTGDSKFCSFTQHQLDIMVDRVAKVYDITANDRFVNVMPLWHAHGQAWHWVARHAKFETHYLPVQHVRSIEKHSPTFISAIPHMIKIFADAKFPHVRFIRSASISMPAQLYLHLKNQFMVPIIEAFGMTETLSQCFTNPLHGPQKIGTVGLPDGVQARLNEGRLEVQGPTVCVPGWFDTGDLASVDEDGYYTILGRNVDRINIKGYKFDPVSLEQQINNTFPELKDLVIFGSTNVNCVYVGDVDPEQIIACMKKIHPACVPRCVKKTNEIPKSQSGKISRKYLADFYQIE